MMESRLPTIEDRSTDTFLSYLKVCLNKYHLIPQDKSALGLNGLYGNS